jgi:hypothetical protein
MGALKEMTSRPYQILSTLYYLHIYLKQTNLTGDPKASYSKIALSKTAITEQQAIALTTL